MGLGLGDRFNVLSHSPHDSSPCTPAKAPVAEGETFWAPSRYTVRATSDDGRLVLWNTYKGTMSVFGVDKKSTIESLLSKKGFAAKPEGIVAYLHDRGFLIKEGTDEFRRIQLGFGQQHYRTDVLELILLASEDCNFRCPYCYEDFARGTMLPEVRQGVKSLVRKKLAGLARLSVSWFGGEPLYGWEALEELGPFFADIAEECGIRYDSNMTTNGYLLTPDVAEKVLTWKINRFQITIDGPAESHNKTRPGRDGSETFDTIFSNLRSMAKRTDHFTVDIRVNFDRNNYPKLTDLMETLAESFKDDPRFRMRFRAVGKWGGDNDASLETCGNDAPKLQMEMKQEAAKLGLNLSDDIRQIGGLGAQVCYAARPYNLIIGAAGQVMKCTVDLDKQDRNIVGHLNDQGELELDQDKMALWTEPAFQSDGKCQKCVILPVCQGVYCPQIRIEHDQSPCTPLRLNYKKELREAVKKASPRRIFQPTIADSAERAARRISGRETDV